MLDLKRICITGVVALCGQSMAAVRAADEPRPPKVAELQAKVDAVLEKVLPAVVAVRKERRNIGSGVIISADGLVLSHGHHEFGTDDIVTIVLADGQEVSARYRFTIKMPKYDCSVLRIKDEGRWRHAELGRMEEVHAGAWCLHVGHPWKFKPGRPPVPRMGSIVETEDVCLSASCMNVGADSGAPLFDEHGRVIGICYGFNFHTTDFAANYTSLKPLRRALEEFQEQDPTARRTLRKRIDRQAPRVVWNPVWEPVRQATVQVNCDGKQRTLGVIVDESGLILTKRSQLLGQIACRLSDERTLDATIAASSPAFDLALLRVVATGLPIIKWSPDNGTKNGLVVVVLGQSRSVLSMGIISDVRLQEVPPTQGLLGLDVEPVNQGLKLIKFKPGAYAQDVLQIGDTITRLDGSEVRTLKEFTQANEKANRIAGDRIAILFLRNGKAMEASVAWSPERYGGEWEREEYSDRRSGFGAVIINEAVIMSHQCGSALVDDLGHVIGLNIARADRHETLTIPSGTVLAELERLVREAKNNTSKQSLDN